MAVHPSSPYSNCALNQHNVQENDDRTEFYGIYGSTPRLVIQGEVISSSANYGSATIFDPYIEDSSAFSIHIAPSITSNEDSFYVEVVIVREAMSTPDEGRLFLGAVEGLIDYEAPNGEDEHHNVFRASYLSIEGEGVVLPENIGDSTVISTSIAIDEEWSLSEMYVMAVLQDDNKSVLQAESSEGMNVDTVQSSGSLGQSEIFATDIRMYPNPTFDELHIEGQELVVNVDVFDLLGQKVISQKANANHVPVSMMDLPAGKFLVRATDSNGKSTSRPIIKY
ncbi:MAG: hypothetical protein Salg2KO_01760 [Salibacteraceae bacterium]